MRAALFPGQGSHEVGMAYDLYQSSETARGMIDAAERMLEIPLGEIMFHGPEDRLVQTGHAQPAIYMHSMVLWTLWGDSRPAFDFAAGHSLGEFSALTAAGAWDVETGLRLVKTRARAMQRACERQPGTMAALVQLPPDQLDPLLDRARGDDVLVAANINSDAQIVISGSRPAVERAAAAAKEAGARRAVLLSVGGAFHSPLMAEARSELAAALDATDIRELEFPVALNVTARPTQDPDEIRTRLKDQLVSPVLWQQTLSWLGDVGMTSCVEIGPGKVLQGLVRKALPSVECSGVQTLADIQAQSGGAATLNP